MKEFKVDSCDKEPMETILEHNTIAMGCSIQCVMLCGAYKILKFQIIDILPYSIELDDLTEKQVVFRKGSHMPNTQSVIFPHIFFLDLLFDYSDDSRCSYMIGPFEPSGSLVEV